MRAEMLAFLNGTFVPEEQAVVSVFDRGFLYGDGLFEVMRIHHGVPFRWRYHMERLEQGARLLNIALPCPPTQLREHADELVRHNELPEALLRITLSRGVGPRGYSPRGADRPTLVMTVHPVPQTPSPPKWKVVTASCRLPANEPLARFKTCNKLPQVLARTEAEAAGADEALLLNTRGEVVEGASSNLFWMDADNNICTPPLESGILAGVTRLVVMEICAGLGRPVRETNITSAGLQHVHAAFLSLSSLGIVKIASVDGRTLGQSPLVNQIRDAYAQALETECR